MKGREEKWRSIYTFDHRVLAMHARPAILHVSVILLVLCTAIISTGCLGGSPQAPVTTPQATIQPPATTLPPVTKTTIQSPSPLPAIPRTTLETLVPASTTLSVPATTPLPSASVPVTIENLEFNPVTITVSAGSTVKWTNLDNVPHDVTTTGQAPVPFTSATLRKGDSYEHTFTQPGTYNYYCSIHPFMKGTVVVTA